MLFWRYEDDVLGTWSQGRLDLPEGMSLIMQCQLYIHHSASYHIKNWAHTLGPWLYILLPLIVLLTENGFKAIQTSGKCQRGISTLFRKTMSYAQGDRMDNSLINKLLRAYCSVSKSWIHTRIISKAFEKHPRLLEARCLRVKYRHMGIEVPNA